MSTTADMPFRASRYTSGAILLHWSIALFIFGLLASGFAMTRLLGDGTQLQFQVYQLHKSFGITVLVLTVARVLWRVFNPPPAEPDSVNALERTVSGLVHMAFYGLLVLIPLSGWFMITVSPVQLETVLFFRSWLPWPHLPGAESLPDEARRSITYATEWVHLVLAYAMAVLIGLHVAGAIKHQLSDGDFIERMSLAAGGDGPRAAYGQATTWLLTIVFAGAMVGGAAYARYGFPTETPRELAAVSPDQPAVLGSGAAIAPGVTPNFAAERAAPAPATDSAAWTVNAENSALTFTVDYSGTTVNGAFDTWTADILFDPDDLAASSVSVTIDTSSARVDSSDISRGNLTGNDGFATRAHDTARFVASTITAEGDGYIADGTLTIRGTEIAQQLPFTVTIEGDRAEAAGSLTLQRLDYDIGRNSDTTGDTLGLGVTVSFAIEATRAAAPTPTAEADTGPAPAWTVFTEESTVGYEFRFQNGRVSGTLPAFAVDLRFDEENLAGSSIIATLETDAVTLKEGGVSLNDVKGSNGLHAARHPEARFVASTITAGDDGTFVAEGTLSARGVSVPVTLPFSLEEVEGRTVATGRALLDRAAFGFGDGAGLSDGDLGPTVAVDLTIVAERPLAEETASQ
ncbi:MAG: YceI family protein [Pseudomonadota bacterium]